MGPMQHQATDRPRFSTVHLNHLRGHDVGRSVLFSLPRCVSRLRKHTNVAHAETLSLSPVAEGRTASRDFPSRSLILVFSPHDLGSLIELL